MLTAAPWPPAAPGTPSDPAREVARILEEAARRLPPDDTRELIGAVRRIVGPMLAGRPATRPLAWRGAADPRLSQAAQAYLRLVRVALYLGARHPGPGAAARLSELGAEIAGDLDRLEASPG
jgi:hypothetical protein